MVFGRYTKKIENFENSVLRENGFHVFHGKISGSHGGKYKDGRLLGRDRMAVILP
jgi:hypothetical protein